MRENPPGGLTCRSVNKKKYIYILEKFSLYFTHLPTSPQWTDLHKIFMVGPKGASHHAPSLNTLLGQTARRIFAHDGSDNAASRKNQTFSETEI